jgi:DNA repair exonuclease SbcCD ATPase subunit
MGESPAPITLAAINGRLHRLQGKREDLDARQCGVVNELEQANEFLAIGDAVTAALEQLSNDVFQRELNAIENTLTKALQEVLDQPVQFKATASFKRDATSVDFSIERNGNTEDIMRGQGGSVANVVSVGLRMFAITTLDEKRHRKFLVLDEQDCWLHPDLVPKLVRIVREAGEALGFQVLMISHHDVANFLRYADRVYRLSPDRGEGVGIEMIQADQEVMESDP